MVNEPSKVAGAQQARKDEPAPGRFDIPKGGDEEENYEQLLDQYGYGARRFAEGDVMKGTVLKITSTDVIVDIGYKSEGIIPVNQFIDSNGTIQVAIARWGLNHHWGTWIVCLGEIVLMYGWILSGRVTIKAGHTVY